jgi:uncharacterized membrane protein YagU involved in acid resistance
MIPLFARLYTYKIPIGTESRMTAASASAAPAASSSSAFLAIFWGGLACGVFDITQACIAWGIQNHLSPMRIFQSVAAGLLGTDSFKGGMKTAILGGVLHFFIAFSWAAIYYIASRRFPLMVEQAVLSGLIYGELVWLAMNFVVIPLSALHRWPVWTKASIITGPIGHLFLVGLPIALAVRRWDPLK